MGVGYHLCNGSSQTRKTILIDQHNMSIIRDKRFGASFSKKKSSGENKRNRYNTSSCYYIVLRKNLIFSKEIFLQYLFRRGRFHRVSFAISGDTMDRRGNSFFDF